MPLIGGIRYGGGYNGNCNYVYEILGFQPTENVQNESEIVINCADVGIKPVILQVTDASGNKSTCATNVTVVDTIAPMAVCKPVTINLNGGGTASITVDSINNGSSDNCGIQSLSLSKTAFDCTDVNKALKFDSITNGDVVVSNNTANIPIGSSARTISAWINPSMEHYNWGIIGQGKATDIFGNGNGELFAIGLQSNNRLTFWGSYADYVSPAVVPMNTWTYVAVTYNGSTGVLYMNDAAYPFSSFGLNTPPSKFFVGAETTTDGADYRTQYQGSIDEVKVYNRALSAAEIAADRVGTNQSGLVLHYPFNEGTGINITDASGNGNDATLINPTGSNWISRATTTLTVTDVNSNQSTCEAMVFVNDTIAPSITCPSNITAAATSASGATVTYTAPVGTDNCTPTTARTAGPASGATFSLGTTTVTHIVTDASGNTSSCSFFVTVSDTTRPTIACAGNVPINTTPGLCTGTTTLTGTTASDNVGVTSLTSNAPATYPVGVNTVTWTATDAANNTATCTQTVTVTDNSTFTCPSDTIVTAESGQCTSVVNYSLQSSTPCGPIVAKNISGFTYLGVFNGSAYYKSNNTFGWIAAEADARANGGHLATIQSEAENQFILSKAPEGGGWIGLNRIYTGNTFVWSNGEPVQYTKWNTSQPDNNLTNGGEEDAVHILDNAYDGRWNDLINTYPLPYILEFSNTGTTRQLVSPLQNSGVFPVGTTTVNYNTTDALGASRTCSFNVMVTDNEKPTISCTNITQSADPGQCNKIITFSLPVVADNCQLAPESLTEFTKLGVYNGNTYYFSNNEFFGTEAFADASSRGGFVSTINDAGENAFVVNAVNTLVGDFPMLIGLNDLASEGTFIWQNGETAAYRNWLSSEPNGAGDEDNVVILPTDGFWNDIPAGLFRYRYVLEFKGSLVQTAGLPSGSTFPVGTTTNRFVITDASGNVDSCTQTVTVTESAIGIYTTAGATSFTNTTWNVQSQAFHINQTINDLDSILIDISWPPIYSEPGNLPLSAVTVRLYAGIGTTGTLIEEVILPSGFGGIIGARDVIPFVQNKTLAIGDYTLYIAPVDGDQFYWYSRNFQTGDLPAEPNFGPWTKLITAYGKSCTSNFAPGPLVENRIVNSKKQDGNFTVRMYPNPAQNDVTFLLKGVDQQAKLNIFDIQGKKISDRIIDAGTERLVLDVSGNEFTNGIFMIMVEKAGDRRYEKLVINR